MVNFNVAQRVNSGNSPLKSEYFSLLKRTTPSQLPTEQAISNCAGGEALSTREGTDGGDFDLDEGEEWVSPH